MEICEAKPPQYMDNIQGYAKEKDDVDGAYTGEFKLYSNKFLFF